MCRLALYSRKAIEDLGRDKMKEFLDHLEKECGGDGNGCLFIEDSKITFEHKGLKFSNEQIVEALYIGEAPDWFMYHTRVASKGTINDSNCHPYTNEDNTFSLMMNGTDGSFGAFGKDTDITDTEVIFKLLNNTGLSLNGLTLLTPRFMGFKDGKVFVTNPSGRQGLEYISNEDYTIIASSFPNEYKEKSLKQEFVWFEGEELIEEPVKVVPIYSDYRYNDWREYIYESPNKVDDTVCKYGFIGVNNKWIGKYTLNKVTKEQIEEVIEFCRDDEEIDLMYDLTQVLEVKFGEVIDYNNECVCFDFMNSTLLLSNPETYDVRYEFELGEELKVASDL